MDSFGYLGITFLILIENIFPPIPSEVILTFGGFMTTYTTLNIPGIIAVSTLGSVLGAIILYEVGCILSKERLERILDGKLGKILHFKKEDVNTAMQKFEHYGSATVFFCRLVPIVRSLISIPAGMTKMSMGKFLLLTTAGSALWNTVLVNLGAFFGASWEKILYYLNTYSHVIFIAIGVTILSCFIFSKIK